jgi:hypothetical protein
MQLAQEREVAREINFHRKIRIDGSGTSLYRKGHKEKRKVAKKSLTWKSMMPDETTPCFVR